MAPALERMEGRDLLSGVLAVLTGVPNPLPPSGFVVAAASGGGGGGGGTTLGQSPMPQVPLVPGQGQPTPRELARETFRAAFSGPLVSGPGRFTDQARILFFRGVGGSSSFLKGDYEMAIVTPTDPTAPTTGFAVMNDKSTNSGGLLGVDLVADPQSFDRAGRPTRLNFISDPNIYSGIFFFNSGSGTVEIKYGKGFATTVFKGRIYTSGLTNPLRNADLYARGGRLFHRS